MQTWLAADEVARRLDQVAIASYDTGLPVESLYGGYVRRQTDVALYVDFAATDYGWRAYHRGWA